MANLELAISMAEQSQERERKAIEELKLMKIKLSEMTEKVKPRLPQFKPRKDQQSISESNRLEQDLQESKLKRENEHLKVHNGRLREEIIRITTLHSKKEDEWSGKLSNLEEGVTKLIHNSQNAISQPVSFGSLCSICEEKSQVLLTLQQELSENYSFLQVDISDHAKYIKTQRKELKEMQSLYEGKVNKLEDLIQDKDRQFGIYKTTSARLVSTSQRETGNFQLHLDSTLSSCQELLQASYDRMENQSKTSVETVSLLRQLLKDEQHAHETCRDQAFREREGLLKSKTILEEQLENQAKLNDAILSREKSIRVEFQERISNLQHQQELVTSERNYLRERVKSFENGQDDLLKQMISEQLIDKISSEEKNAIGILKSSHSKVVEDEILSLQVECLQKEISNLKSVNLSLNQDREWIQKERDAVGEGALRQQMCLKNQLHAIDLLKESLENLHEDKLQFLKDQVSVFDCIKSSLVSSEPETDE